MLVSVLVTSARILPIFAIAPFLGRRLPAPARIAGGLAVVLVVFPAVQASLASAAPIAGAQLAALLCRELLVGLALGFLVTLPFAAFEGAGRLVDQARGATLADVLAPGTAEQTSVLGALFLELSVVLFVLLGGHLLFLRGVAVSYAALPLYPASPGLAGMDVALDLARDAGRMLEAAVLLSAPALLGTLLADLVLGLIGRAAPALGSFFVALPIKAWLALGLVLLGASLVAGDVHAILPRMLGDMARLLRALR